MMSKAVLYSSKKDDWGTPQELFDALHREFKFDCDVCSDGASNCKLPNTITKSMDALKVDWLKYGNVFFMNPPYSRSKPNTWDFVKKAHEMWQRGAKVVMLLPARTDVSVFHDYILGVAEVRFLRGRLKFEGAKDAAPFPSMVVVYD